MKKSIFLFFAAILCATSAWGKTIYFKPSNDWKKDNAWFQVWDGKANHAFTETAISGLYQADIRDEATHIYIKRKKPNTDTDWDGGSETQIGSYNYFYNIDWSNQMGKTSIIGIVTGGHIYFDNSETKWTGNIQFVVGHDNYSRTYEMTQISNTQLWYVDISKNDNHTWGDAKYYGFIASTSKFGDGSWGSSNLNNATSYSKAYTSAYSLNDGAIYYCKMSATPNGSTFSIEYKGSTNDITKFAAKQAVKVRATKNDAYANATGTWPITISTKGTYLSKNGQSGNSDISGSKSDDGNQYDAVVTGKIIHTYSNLSDDYKFEGWGTADAPTSTDDSYEYNITANTTIYAYLTQKYQITFNGNANGSVSATADGQPLTSTHKVIGGTTITLTATANPGYEFTGWSDGSTVNPYTFTATEDVELVANFEKETYTRTVTQDNYGTICLPFGSSEYSGAEFYEVSYVIVGKGLWLDQLEDNTPLEAGKPYIFKATATELVVVSNATEVAAPVAGTNGLTGTFTDIAAGALEDHYIIAENKVWVAGTGATLPANRAYINSTLVPTTEQPKLAGRRRVCMGENATTDIDNITNNANTTIKVIENGQLIIIRNGEKFNAQGVRF